MAAPHAQSGIPFPLHKWACVEVMDNDTVPCEASHSDCQMPLHDKGRDACSITGNCNVVIYPTAFWSKLTGNMHRMHFMTHQHAQATRTLESLVDLSTPCQLGTMGIYIVMLPQAVHTHGTLALLSIPPSWHYEDVLQDPHYDHANYNDPGPSNVPYNLLYRYYHLPTTVRGISLHPIRHHIPSHPDHHVYHDAPYISDYYPPAQPTAQQWVDRGSAAQYEDEFPEDYLDY
ncbi:hypothetical protein BKA82DRAFT_4019804 [Pisolithus tinctorius]|nr:hypothetical protein BKA82DRAFT_4019804 [Pisolithus tinctorius]